MNDRRSSEAPGWRRLVVLGGAGLAGALIASWTTAGATARDGGATGDAAPLPATPTEPSPRAGGATSRDGRPAARPPTANNAGGTGGALPGATTSPPAPAAKAALLARLGRLNQSDHFLFGQENATLWGMYLNGGLVSTNKWFESTARVGRYTSDSEAVVGDAPAVLGVSLDMLAFEPTDWNRRNAVAGAISRQIEQGGVVTMDWHAPSCDAAVPAAAKPLATVKVQGHDVRVWPVPGGSWFYADEEYTHAIRSRADVPDALKCLCQIANDLPITAGAYRGVSGKSWLVAHAKHAAQVLRDQGLADLPIIVRPFHEHNGSWFWWGQPYWSCAALLDQADALSGPAAYEEVARTFVSSLRSEPGMANLLFAYSTDKVLGPRETERFTGAENKVTDPSGYARDLLRERLQRELQHAGLADSSAAQRDATAVSTPAMGTRRAASYVSQRRAMYIEAYAGDDVYDVLGMDLYHPMARPANRADLRLFGLQLRVLAEEARARGKPYALTEAGSYRLQLERLTAGAPPGGPIVINSKSSVDEALARLFDPLDRTALLRHFGLSASGPISLSARERAVVVPKISEDWFNQQLLVLARQARVAFALVWQTYYDSGSPDRYFHYYVPHPGHPDAGSYQRFYADPATCFLRDGCER